MRVSLTRTITVEQTRDERVRREGAKLADKGTIGKLLESMTDDNRPVILEIYGVREDRQPGDFFMRECKGIFIYEGVKYQAFEKERREESARGEKERLRDVELNRIKTRLRAVRQAEKTEDQALDRKDEELWRKQKEDEIEREAAAILKKEEETIK